MTQAATTLTRAGTYSDFALVRYNTDGSLDTTFSGDGKLTTAISMRDDGGYSVSVQTDGKILVAGGSYNGTNGDFALVRYNTDGSLDTTFSGDGILTTTIGTSNESGSSVTVQADGKILVAGSSYNGTNYDFALVRYNTDGSLDTTFSGDGKLTTEIGGWDLGNSVTVQADGKILVAGGSTNGTNNVLALIRYNTDGSLDTTFDPTYTLGGTAAYAENGSAAILDGDVVVTDMDLSAVENYLGATLTLVRNGSANAEDFFSGAGIASGQASGDVTVSSTAIGTYTYAAGSLTLTFNSNATQSLVNQAMQSLAYSNNNDNPSASVQINWTFNDGNTGLQGTGGALSVTGSTTVNITAANDAPVLAAAAPTLTTISEDAITNTGQTVASFLGASLTDVDVGALQGITLYGTTGSYGAWQYSTNGGTSWTSVGTVSKGSALLLRSTDYVRWLPDGFGTTATLN